jgi:hypothetical protein
MTATVRKPAKLVLQTPSRPVAPALRLTPPQELALLARVLFREGYGDHLAGHITYKQEDGTFLVNPFGPHPDVVHAFGDSFNTNTFPGLFPAMARREIRRDPSVLN